MRLGDEQISALLKLADSQLQLGQLRQADKSFETLLKYMPAHPDALFGLAEIARRKNKPKRQRELLTELVSVHPQHLQGVLVLSQALAPEQALPYLERALEAHPGAPELLLATADALLRTVQPERAGFYLAQASAQAGQLNGENWLNLARLQLRCGELAAAAKGFEQAVRLDPALRHDPRWVDIEARWRQLEARQSDTDLDALVSRLRPEQT